MMERDSSEFRGISPAPLPLPGTPSLVHEEVRILIVILRTIRPSCFEDLTLIDTLFLKLLRKVLLRTEYIRSGTEPRLEVCSWFRICYSRYLSPDL